MLILINSLGHQLALRNKESLPLKTTPGRTICTLVVSLKILLMACASPRTSNRWVSRISSSSTYATQTVSYQPSISHMIVTSLISLHFICRFETSQVSPVEGGNEHLCKCWTDLKSPLQRADLLGRGELRRGGAQRFHQSGQVNPSTGHQPQWLLLHRLAHMPSLKAYQTLFPAKSQILLRTPESQRDITSFRQCPVWKWSKLGIEPLINKV